MKELVDVLNVNVMIVIEHTGNWKRLVVTNSNSSPDISRGSSIENTMTKHVMGFSLSKVNTALKLDTVYPGFPSSFCFSVLKVTNNWNGSLGSRLAKRFL